MTQNAPKIGSADQEISLIEIFVLLRRHLRLLMALPVLGALVGALAGQMIAPTFTSTTRLLPPQSPNSGSAALLGQLGAASALAGGVVGVKTQADVYVAILESRTVADELIRRFALKDRYRSATMDSARRALSGARQISLGKKDGLIAVSVIDEDPVFAAELANAHAEELIKTTQTLAVTEAAQRRVFFEQQLISAKEKLAKAETEFRIMQEQTGMLQPSGQAQAIIAGAAQLRGAIAAKEVQLDSLRIFATPHNPEFVKVQEELRGLQGQLARIERSKSPFVGEILLPGTKFPVASAEYARALRDVKYEETIFELLARQYESAKIDEAKNAPVVQVLDVAVPPELKTGPKRAVIVLVGLFLGLIAALLTLAFRYFYERLSTEFMEREGKDKQLVFQDVRTEVGSGLSGAAAYLPKTSDDNQENTLAVGERGKFVG